MATEQSKIIVDVQTGEAGKSLRQLRTEFKELQKQLENAQVGTKEYTQTLVALGQKKDDIIVLNEQISGLAGGGGKLQTVGKAISGIAGGFSAATGAAALFGTQSEEVEQALLKVQAALALQQGIAAVEGLGDVFKTLGVIIKANPLIFLGTVIAGLIGYFVGLDDIIAGVKKGFEAVGEAAKVVWDAIVEGVKFAIDIYTQYLDLLTFGLFDLNGAYKGYIKNIEDANEAERKRIAALKEEEKIIKETIKSLEEQISAINKAQKAVEEREAAVVKAYDREIELASAAGRNTETLEADKLQFVKQSLEERIRLQLKEFELSQKIAEEKVKLVENTEKQYGKFGARFDKIISDAYSKQVDSNKKALDNLRSLLDETNHKIEVDEAESLKVRQDAWKTAQEERVSFLKELTKEAREDSAEATQQIIDNDKALEAISAEQRKKQIEAGKAQRKKDLADEKARKEKEEADKKEADDKELKWIEERNKLRIESVTNTLSILSNLNELFAGKSKAQQERAFKIQKGINIATALIDTYRGVNAALALPPPFGLIQAGVTLTAGLLNVKKIASTQFDSGSSSAPSSSSSSAPSASSPTPNGSTSIDTTLLNRQQIESGNQPQDSRVVVLESDITNTQSRVEGIQRRARVV